MWPQVFTGRTVQSVWNRWLWSFSRVVFCSPSCRALAVYPLFQARKTVYSGTQAPFPFYSLPKTTQSEGKVTLQTSRSCQEQFVVLNGHCFPKWDASMSEWKLGGGSTSALICYRMVLLVNNSWSKMVLVFASWVCMSMYLARRRRRRKRGNFCGLLTADPAFWEGLWDQGS